MGFTEQQAEAIYTLKKNLVVAAGAGSGKTRVLVERYIELLNHNTDWSLNSLVAITFTREAALEMRNRVREELENRLRQSEGVNERWSNLLSEMDSARIDTIHGLCATILRANAAEAGIDPGFEVLDEIDRALMLDDVIGDVLQSLSASDPDGLLYLFTEYDTRSIRQALAAGELLAKPLTAPPEDASSLFQLWAQQWEQNCIRHLNALLHNDAFMDALDWQPPGAFPQNDKLSPSWANVHERRGVVLDIDRINEAYEAVQFLSTTGGITLNGGTIANWGSKQIVEDSKHALNMIRTTFQNLLKALGTPPGELDIRAGENIIRWCKLVLRVQAAYTEAKQTVGVLDFNDLELLTAALLHRHEHVRRRYQGVEFKYMLVDEFQDTNQIQWEIVRALTDPDNQTMLFVVGDLKQSIYGFRGADVSVFDGVRHFVSSSEFGLALSLSESFRSHPGLIGLFNELFRRILVKDPASLVEKYQVAFDEPLTANRTRVSFDVPVELLLLPERKDLHAADMRRWEAYEIARKLKFMHTQGAEIRDRRQEDEVTRPFQYGDAAILFRSMSQVNIYETALKAAGIPYVTVAGRGYYNRQEVWDMLNLLKALHNPLDNLALASVLRSPLFGFSDEMLLALRRVRTEPENPKSPPVNLWFILETLAAGGTTVTGITTEREYRRIQRACHILNQLKALAGRVTVSELMRRALAETGYLAILNGLPDGVRKRRNVEKLLEIAVSSGRLTPGAFWQYLEQLTIQEVREGEALLDTEGAVRLMTVHASKGLEFPVVILADAGWSRMDNNPPLLITGTDGQLYCKVFDAAKNTMVKPFAYEQTHRLQQERDTAESKRLLYVAATRARDWLVISGTVQKNKSDEWESAGWMQMMLQAAGITGHGNASTILIGEDGALRIHVPEYDAEALERQEVTGTSGSAWQRIDALASEAVPAVPPLLHPYAVPPEVYLGHLAATQLASIGGAKYAASPEERDYHRRNVRRTALYDTPPAIKSAIRTIDPRVTQRIVGEIVHEAIRYGRFPDTTPNLEEVLRSYAWHQNLVEEADIERAVHDSTRLLQRFQSSDVYTWLTAAQANHRPVYPELPFIYRAGKRILHGIIDVLLRQADGSWALVDYKTGFVKNQGSMAAAQAHAQRYLFQVGAYAAAVEQQLQILPEVYIHYIRYNRTVRIPAEAWQPAIQQLEASIGDLVSNRYD